MTHNNLIDMGAWLDRRGRSQALRDYLDQRRAFAEAEPRDYTLDLAHAPRIVRLWFERQARRFGGLDTFFQCFAADVERIIAWQHEIDHDRWVRYMFTGVLDRHPEFSPDWAYWIDDRLRSELPARIWDWLARGAALWGLAPSELFREIYEDFIVGWHREPEVWAVRSLSE